MAKVMDACWKNEDQHRTDYLPIVLVNDIVRMASMTPIERLESLRSLPDAPIGTLDELRELYVQYLRATDGGKTALTDRLTVESDVVRDVSKDGREFTRHMFDLVQMLGGGRTPHRAIVV